MTHNIASSKEYDILDMDILERMVAACPKKGEVFTGEHWEKLNNATKLDNDEDPVEKVSFYFQPKHIHTYS
jgi:hypothetical protein